MKDALKLILDNDTSYNKSASRYLYKSHPELWNEVCKLTEFLPDTAKAKQRIWHVLNDVYYRPVCPITGEHVKWWENRYLITSSHSARIKLQHARGDFVNGHSPENNEKRRQGNLAAVAAGRKYRSKESYTDAQKQKSKQTCLARYGVENGAQSTISREKIYQKSLRYGATPREQRSLRRLYYDAVWKFTEDSWKKDFDKINPERLNRTSNALDHIYSIQQGFRDNIPPYIIGHWTNLRIISLTKNSIKGMRCDKTQTELFEDFFDCVE